MNRAALLDEKVPIDFVSYARLKFLIDHVATYYYVIQKDGPARVAKRLAMFTELEEAELFRDAKIEQFSGQDWKAALIADTTGEVK